MVELFLWAPVCVGVCVCVCVCRDRCQEREGRRGESSLLSVSFLSPFLVVSIKMLCDMQPMNCCLCVPASVLVVSVLSLSLSHCVVLRPTPWDFLSLGNKITGDNDDDDNKDSRPTETKTLPTTRYNVPRMMFLFFLWLFHQNDCSFLIG